MDKTKPTPETYANKPICDDDNPELTEQDFANGRPFKEAFPEHYAAWDAGGRAPIPVRRTGRPAVAQPKVQIGLRLSQDVVARIRASGAGYNARVEKVLREALEAGRL